MSSIVSKGFTVDDPDAMPDGARRHELIPDTGE